MWSPVNQYAAHRSPQRTPRPRREPALIHRARRRVRRHLLASCSSDASLLFYDVTKRAVVRAIRLDRPLTCMAFASSGLHCAAGTSSGAFGASALESFFRAPRPHRTTKSH